MGLLRETFNLRGLYAWADVYSRLGNYPMCDLHESLAKEYESDIRPTDELVALLLEKDLNVDELPESRALYVLQYRLPLIFSQVEQLAKSRNSLEREAAALILGVSWSMEEELRAKTLAVLASMLKENPAYVGLTCTIIYSLGHLHDPQARDLVLPYHLHEHEDVRLAAACSLGGYENDEAVRAQILLSRDSDLSVRNWATFGLGSLLERDTAEVRNALADRLSESDDEIRWEALVGLVIRGDLRAIEVFRSELSKTTKPTFSILRECIDVLVEKRESYELEWRPVFEDLERLGLLEERAKYVANLRTPLPPIAGHGAAGDLQIPGE